MFLKAKQKIKQINLLKEIEILRYTIIDEFIKVIVNK